MLVHTFEKMSRTSFVWHDGAEVKAASRTNNRPKRFFWKFCIENHNQKLSLSSLLENGEILAISCSVPKWFHCSFYFFPFVNSNVKRKWSYTEDVTPRIFDSFQVTKIDNKAPKMIYLWLLKARGANFLRLTRLTTD